MMNDDYIFIHGNNISMMKLLVRQLSHTEFNFTESVKTMFINDFINDYIFIYSNSQTDRQTIS